VSWIPRLPVDPSALTACLAPTAAVPGAWVALAVPVVVQPAAVVEGYHSYRALIFASHVAEETWPNVTRHSVEVLVEGGTTNPAPDD
jgi:hypothetical protein